MLKTTHDQETSMNSIRTAVIVAVGLIMVLWWAVMPPSYEPAPLPRIETQKQQQCPVGSRLEGKLCVCPAGTSWTGKACTQFSAAAPADRA